MLTLFRLLGSVRSLWPYYLAVAVCSILTTATGLAGPFLIAGVVDRVVQAVSGKAPVSTSAVVWLAVALLVVDVANTLISNVGGYLGDVMSARLRATMSERYYAKLLRLPQSWFDEELSGTIVNRLNRSITETASFVQAAANNFVPMVLTVVATLAVSAWYSWPLALLLLVIFPTFAWLTTLSSTRWQQLEKLKNTDYDVAGGRFAEVVGQVRVVKSFLRERAELAHFRARYDAATVTTRTQSRWWHLMDVTRRGALNLIFFGVYLILFLATMQGQFSVGVLVLLLQLIAMARQPVTIMSYLVDTGQRAIAGSRDYLAVLDVAEEEQAVTAAAPAPVAGAPAVEFEHVSFAYGDGPEVLHDVSFRVAAGQRVALVGESGGGKTTLVNLLLGLYRPTAGSVRLGGHDERDLGLQTVRQQVGVVFQEAALFSGTVAENVAYGRPDATAAEIRGAAIRANADRFVEAFPDGYDTLIGERGLKLSGGQKQRIAVARAILKDAPVLVLDEATSALDTKAERLVQAGLDELMAGRTSIIIAHRLSTISSVDVIVTLRDGAVDEVGSPDELARSGGIYSELLALQASATRADRKRLAAFDIAG